MQHYDGDGISIQRPEEVSIRHQDIEYIQGSAKSGNNE